MEQLKTLRLARGYSLDELAARIGGLVSKQMLSKYETGKSRPSLEVAQALASALGVKVTALYEAPAYDLEFIAYRKLSGLTKGSQGSMQAFLGEELRQRLDVQQRLGLHCEFQFLRREVATQQDIEDQADALRQKWGLGLEPIGNLMDVLERKGVHVVNVSAAPGKFHGISAVARTQGEFCGAMIAYREVDAGERQRSTLAHELGHLLLKVSGDLDEEKAVQSFAGAFLMPRALMFETLGRKRSNIHISELLTWKAFFGTSMQAILYRAKTLEIISETYFKEWIIAISRQGWRKAEPRPLPTEQPRYWPQLVQRAVAEAAITAQEANRLIPGIVPEPEVGTLNRRALLRLAPEKRRALLEEQASAVAELYQPGSNHTEWVDDQGDEDILDAY